jgi:hypothetical protein
VFPRFIKGSGFDSAPSSLSIWQDIESLMAFAYAGVHAEALKNARNWNQKERLAAAGALVGRAGQRPDWEQAADKLEWLHDHGPARKPLPSSRPTALTASLWRSIAARQSPD